MKKIFNLLKKSLPALLLIFILLIIQVQCDLKLPEYTANIINVGIQQKGIEDGVPNVIREDNLKLAFRFVEENSLKFIKENYDLITKESNDYEEYLKDYNILKTENLYILKNISKDTRENLDDALFEPLIIVYFLTTDAEEFVNMRKNMFPNATENIDMKLMIMNMSEEQISAIKENFTQFTKDIEMSLLTQMSTGIVTSEYEAIGFDLKTIQTNYLLSAGIKMLGMAMVAMVITIAIAYLSSRVGAGFSRDLRYEVTSKVMNFSNQEFDSFGTASLITRSTNDIQQVQMFIIMFLRIILYSPLLGLGALEKVSDSSMSWVIGLAVLIIFTLVGVLLVISLPKFKSLQKLIDKLNLISREILTGLPVIRAFATDKKEEDRFDKANNQLTKTNLFVNRVMTIMMPTMMFIMNGVSVLIIWVGAKYVDLGTMQIGTLMAFITYAMQIIMSFLMLTMISIMMPRALVSLKRISEIFNKDISVKNATLTIDLPKEISGEIEFRDVYFRYPDANEDVLENINFKIKANTTTAFIGSTGSGKSTLVNLIPRFFDITAGKILLDGIDIRDLDLEVLRKQLGFVPQKGVLFTGTIASNIAFGNEEIDMKMVKKAAKIAQASEFVEKMEDGYESSISQGGINVSGGQKQRLAIARAIAKNPKVLIFDDSFSALDYKTDRALRQALKQEFKNKTVLIVASRIATIMDADNIIVLDNGNIVGMGTHKKLLSENEIYKEIAYSQLSEEELNHV